MFYSFQIPIDKTKVKFITLYYHLYIDEFIEQAKRCCWIKFTFSQNLDFFLNSLGTKQKRIILNEFDKLINNFSFESSKETDLIKSLIEFLRE